MKSGWFKMPLEPAAAWFRLSVIVRAIGVDLFRLYQDSVIGVPMSEAEDVLVRMLGPDPRERKAVRHAIRGIIEAGLLVEVEGGVRLLYSRESHSAHYARSTDGARKVDGRSTHGLPMVDGRSTDGAQTVGAKSAESHDGDLQIDREKDREKEREKPSAAGAASPGAEPKARKTRTKPGALVALESALEAAVGKGNAPALSQSLGAKASRRVSDYAEAKGLTLEASAALLAGAWKALGTGNAWKLCDVPFEAPTVVPGSANAIRSLPPRQAFEEREGRLAELRAKLSVLETKEYEARLVGDSEREKRIRERQNELKAEMRALKGAA